MRRSSVMWCTGWLIALAAGSAAADPPDLPVTGSRIERPTWLSAAPLTVLDRDDLDTLGSMTLDDIVRQLPVQSSATAVQLDVRETGATRADLRGLGPGRSLTLVNGRSVVGSATSANPAVDLGAIPLAAVERIEIQRAGGSAIYGSDAIGGVVNVITRRDLDGSLATLYAGSADHGDAFTYDASVVTGQHTADGKASLLIAAGFQHHGSVLARDRAFAADPTRFEPARDRDLEPQASAGSLYGAGSYAVWPGATAFFEASYLRRTVARRFEPTRLSQILLSKDSVYNPFGADLIVYPASPIALGPRHSAQQLDAFQLTTGLSGALSGTAPALDSWRWEASYSYGRSTGTRSDTGALNRSRAASAFGPSFRDANTTAVCGTRVEPIADCSPIDPATLGDAGDPGALDYLRPTTTSSATSRLHSVLVTAHGRLIELPDHGELSAAVGGDLRASSSSFAITPDDAGAVSGSQRALEGFGELSLVPISGHRIVDRLELDVAVRGSHYSSFGRVMSWTASGLVRTIEGIAVRGSYATAFRAPTIDELFEPRRVQATGFSGAFGSREDTITSGNPQLAPETATITTAGVVFEPPRIPPLSVTVDYWSIDLAHAIRVPSAAGLIAGCYTLHDPALCARFHIDPPGDDAVDSYDRTVGNGGATSMSGLDVAAAYGRGFGALGVLHVRLDAQAILSHETTELVGLPAADFGGSFELNASLATRWSHPSGLAVGVNLHYLGRHLACGQGDCVAGSLSGVGGWNEVDLHGSYAFDSPAGTTTLSLGINNALDAAPPIPSLVGGGRLPSELGGGSSYDLVGRFIYLRLAQRF